MSLFYLQQVIETFMSVCPSVLFLWYFQPHSHQDWMKIRHSPWAHPSSWQLPSKPFCSVLLIPPYRTYHSVPLPDSNNLCWFTYPTGYAGTSPAICQPLPHTHCWPRESELSWRYHTPESVTSLQLWPKIRVTKYWHWPAEESLDSDGHIGSVKQLT